MKSTKLPENSSDAAQLLALGKFERVVAIIAADQNEARNQSALLDYLRNHVEITTGSYNETAGSLLVFPDFTVWGGEHLTGWNRKTWTEVLGGLDKVTEQLQRELAGPVEYLCLGIEGAIRADSTGVWAYDFDWDRLQTWKSPMAGTLPFKRQRFGINSKAVVAWEQSLSQQGVAVYHCADPLDTAAHLVALHDLTLRGGEHRTLSRLIKVKHQVNCLPEERAMALTLMGIEGAGVGEATALAISQSFSNLVELLDYWRDGGTISDTMLPNGTRRIGTVAEQKLQKALGYESSKES